MAAAALPAPTTSVRPWGGPGRCGGTIWSGSAAATAVRKLASSSARASEVSILRGIRSDAHHFQHGPVQRARRIGEPVEHGEVIVAGAGNVVLVHALPFFRDQPVLDVKT